MKRFFSKPSQRGFIGPIGDDLPSLIPLTIALMIFFAAFGFAFNEYEQRQSTFDQRLLLLAVGKTLKGDALIDTFDKWRAACNSLEVNRYKFRAVVFEISTEKDAAFFAYEFFADQQTHDGGSFSDTSDERIFVMSPTERLVCDNFNETDVFNPANPLDEIDSSAALRQQTLRINFPVAIQKDHVNYPGILSVMVWRA